MKKNTQIFLAVSLSAIFVVSALSLQEAEASGKHNDFEKKPSFISELNPVLGFNGTANAKFWLDEDGEALKYVISIKNMDIIGFGVPNDDVTKLHFHEGTHGAHVLNVYKAPGQDDNDLVVKPTKGIIKGIWDDSDENLSYGGHLNSHTLTSQLGELCDGNLFTMIHGYNGIGVLKGSIIPTSNGEEICSDLDEEHEDDDHDEDHDDDD